MVRGSDSRQHESVGSQNPDNGAPLGSVIVDVPTEREKHTLRNRAGILKSQISAELQRIMSLPGADAWELAGFPGRLNVAAYLTADQVAAQYHVLVDVLSACAAAPPMNRPAAATFRVRPPESYCAGSIPAGRILSMLAGEALRLESYAATGLIDLGEPVPTDILSAAHAL